MKNSSIEKISLKQKKIDEFFMEKVFELARKPNGLVSPNPYVGAIIVNENNQIISKGLHRGPGKYHAEREAINKAKIKDLSKCTLYTNLEPCCHTKKKTPPCLPLVIEKNFKRIVISNKDPNPLVSGKSIRILKKNKIQVSTNVLKTKGERLNEIFFYHIKNKKPFIHLKWAQTIDAQICNNKGKSKWITNGLSRKCTHEQRQLYDAILVGAQTINKDNPSLDIRLSKINPKNLYYKKIILSPNINLNFNRKIFKDAKKNIFIICHQKAFDSKIKNTKRENKFNFITYKGSVDITQKKLDLILQKLYQNNIFSIYIEGGANTLSLFIKHKLFNRISIYQAPFFLGQGKSINNFLPINNKELNFLKLNLKIDSLEKNNNDVLINYCYKS